MAELSYFWTNYIVVLKKTVHICSFVGGITFEVSTLSCLYNVSIGFVTEARYCVLQKNSNSHSLVLVERSSTELKAYCSGT